MVAKSRAADAKMKALVEAYAASLVGRLHELETLAGQLSGGGPFEEVHRQLEEIHALVHKIAGTAGMFGFPAVTDQARAIEEGVRPLIDAKQPLTADQADAIEVRITVLKELIPVKPGPETGPEPGADAPSGAPAADAAAADFVILLAPAGGGADSFARQIETAGYRVQRVSGDVDGIGDVGQARIRAILVDAAMPDGFKICRKLSDIFRAEFRVSVPIIVLSSTGDYQTRLRAVQSGARAFFVAPLDARAIVGKIFELSSSIVFAPHRVLIVEDVDKLTTQASDAFDGPGYASRVVKKPSELLHRLETFDPELVLMDLSVAGTSGLDLAKVIWQQDNHQNIAILFMTPGPEFNEQLLQLGLSDEFFVPRPIDVHALRVVAARYLADLRGGRRPSNFYDLFADLDRIAALTEPRDKAGERHPAPSESAAAPQAHPKILVVDDDRHLVDAIAIKLSGHGFEVLKAFSIKQGLTVAWEERPDLVITDYLLPDGSGDYLVGRLKGEVETQDVPIIVVTAHSVTVDGRKDHALERDFMGRLGAASFLAKPIDLDALVAEVGRFVRLPSAGA